MIDLSCETTFLYYTSRNVKNEVFIPIGRVLNLSKSLDYFIFFNPY